MKELDKLLRERQIMIETKRVIKGEVWKNIPGYEDFNQVSNFGRVKSIRNGEVQVLRDSYNNGYKTVCLNTKNKRKRYGVHQLVAMAFLGHKPCGLKLVVNHINFIRDDNRLENLEVVTHRENTNRKHLPSTSKYTGVHWNKRNKKWTSAIGVMSKVFVLGHFDCEIEASNAYERKLKEVTSRSCL